MKHISFVALSIILLLLGQKIYAQVTIYVSPLIYYKLLVTEYDGDQRFGFYIENKPSVIQNPYYSFEAKRLSHVPSVNIGLRLLALTNNEKHFISIEWAQDEMGTMSKETELVNTNQANSSYPVYSTETSYFQTGFAFNRFSLQYGRKLLKKQNIYAMFDFSFATAQFNVFEWTYDSLWVYGTTYYHNQAIPITKTIQSVIWDGKYILLGLGLKSDISVNNKLKHKSTYLFSIEIHYRQGTKVMGGSDYISVIKDNGKLLAFHNGLTSRGSGIYIQISRRFKIKRIGNHSSVE